MDDTPGGTDAGSGYVFVRSGTNWTQQQKLLGSDGALTSDFFGYEVSVSGDTVVVGAFQDDTPAGADAGSAYVFVRSGMTWSEQQKLLSPDAVASEFFGYSVSVSGDTVVVGAPSDGALAGAAYVFVRAGTIWTEQQKLLASDGMVTDRFGSSVSVSGDTVVVGAALHDTSGGGNAGSAYVFVRVGTTWSEQQKLLASDGAQGDQFGSSVSISGNTVVVSAAGDNVGTGSAYVFVRSGTSWSEQQKLLASDGAFGDGFGFSVSLFGDTVLVGGPFHDTSPPSPNAGSAYVFVRSGATWTQQQELLALDGAAEDLFGASVSVFEDTAVVGAPTDVPSGTTGAGSTYVFARSGTTWTQQQKLLAPDGAASDGFGSAVSLSGDGLVVGAPLDDTPGGVDAGSAHVFRDIEADLGGTKTDGQTTAVPGQPLTYTITASNAGPSAVTGATVTDALPAALLGPTWGCVASPGSSCTLNGSGDINDTVNLAVGGTATYTVTGTVGAGATGTICNTVTVTPPGGVPDPNPANNSSTDTDTLTPEADLGLTKTDSADPVSPGDPLAYSLTISNAGPSDATLLTVTDSLPPGVTFISSSPGPPECILVGVTLNCDLGTLTAGGSTVVTINVTVNASAGGVLVNTAGASGSETDPNPVDNSASATTIVRGAAGELVHGTQAYYDLAAQPGPAPDQDVFLISQKPYSSYEIVVDATSGDIGAGAGPFLERIGPDGTALLQTSSPIGTGSSRSLRWGNTTANEVDDQTIRVHSAGCGTACGPDDVYRIRAYETSYSAPRFNNAGTQITVLVLQNPTNYTISGEVCFRISSGALVAVQPFSLNPRTTLVLDTATVPGANGVSGTMTVAHDGRYGDLVGKTVAVEPATGFSLDSPLLPRPR